MSKFKIEMIHDLVCSWCPIGYKNIMTAINNLGLEFDFHFLPYELNPNMDKKGESISSYFTRQYDWSEHKLNDYQTSLINTANKAGVSMNFNKRTHYFNTHAVHKLMHWAEKFNKQIALNEKLIKAYFEQGLDINNIDVLLNLTEELGLDKTSTIQALQSSKLEQEVNRKVERLKAFKIRSIPAFIINENTFMSGSHSVGFFEENLSKIINDPENQYALKFKETSDAIY